MPRAGQPGPGSRPSISQAEGLAPTSCGWLGEEGLRPIPVGLGPGGEVPWEKCLAFGWGAGGSSYLLWQQVPTFQVPVRFKSRLPRSVRIRPWFTPARVLSQRISRGVEHGRCNLTAASPCPGLCGAGRRIALGHSFSFQACRKAKAAVAGDWGRDCSDSYTSPGPCSWGSRFLPPSPGCPHAPLPMLEQLGLKTSLLSHKGVLQWAGGASGSLSWAHGGLTPLVLHPSHWPSGRGSFPGSHLPV